MNTGIAMIGVENMDSLYEQTVEGIEIVLKHRYKMTSTDAKAAISISPLKSVFERHGEIAAHTSCEALARDVYEYWRKQKRS